MHIVGAIFFFLLAAVLGAYGLINLFTVTQTIFGPAKVGLALPILQFLLSLLCIGAAIASARACAHCRKRYMADKGKSA